MEGKGGNLCEEKATLRDAYSSITCILLTLSISNILGCRKMTLVLYSKDKKSYSRATWKSVPKCSAASLTGFLKGKLNLPAH